MPSFSEVELLNSWPKIDLVWIIAFLYPKSILLNYWQLTRMHLMSTRARSSSKLQSVHSRVLEVQFSSDQDHSTWNSNLNAVYVFKFLYRHFSRFVVTQNALEAKALTKILAEILRLVLGPYLHGVNASLWPLDDLLVRLKHFHSSENRICLWYFFLFFILFVNCSE